MRGRSVEWLLAFLSTLVTYLFAELMFSFVGLRYVPLRLQADLPTDVRVFAQSSKKDVVPEDAVVLLGDSYAKGSGDWLLEADPDRNGDFGSAHVINRVTKRDVVTLGVPGAGSAEGIAAFPSIAFANAKGAWYLRLSPPHIVVIYFYEGNDLNNNLQFLIRRGLEKYDSDNLAERIDQAIAAYPAELQTPTSWRRHFPLLAFSYHIVQRTLLKPIVQHLIRKPPSSAKTPEPDIPTQILAGLPNVVEIEGQPIELPPGLQSPAMELTSEELQRAILVFERSLIFLRRIFPDTPFLVVYLPAPLSSYRLLSPEVSIQPYMLDRTTRYPKQQVVEDSDTICQLIRLAAISQGAGFVDVRPFVRAASARSLLHGPHDNKHFNRKGMEVLGRAVSQRINSSLDRGSCAQGDW